MPALKAGGRHNCSVPWREIVNGILYVLPPYRVCLAQSACLIEPAWSDASTIIFGCGAGIRTWTRLHDPLRAQ